MLGKLVSDRVGGMLDSQPETPRRIKEEDIEERLVEEKELEIESSEAKKISRVKLEGVESQLEKYKFLKDRGYPVPERAFKGPGASLLVSDLTKNGERRVYSVNDWPDEIERELVNMEEIGKQLKRVADKAEEDELMITMDSYFLLVEPEERRGEVVIGDFGAAGIDQEEKQALGYGEDEGAREAAGAFYDVVSKRFSKDKDGRIQGNKGYLWKT